MTRTLEEAFHSFCLAFEIAPIKERSLFQAWSPVLRLCGKGAIRALVDLSLSPHSFGHPRLGDIVRRAEHLICKPVDPIWAWFEAQREVSGQGERKKPHPSIVYAVKYVGAERIKNSTMDNIGDIKREFYWAIKSYNRKTFMERCVLEGIFTHEEIKRWPRYKVYAGA